MQDERMCPCIQKQLDRFFQRLKNTKWKLIKGEMKKKLKDIANKVSLQQQELTILTTTQICRQNVCKWSLISRKLNKKHINIYFKLLFFFCQCNVFLKMIVLLANTDSVIRISCNSFDFVLNQPFKLNWKMRNILHITLRINECLLSLIHLNFKNIWNIWWENTASV